MAKDPDSQILDLLVQKIVQAVNPLRILLFGSAARGEMRHDSDIDLLIVMPEGTNRRQTAQYLYRHLRNIKVPFDLLVATPSDLEKYRDTPGLVYASILREGKDLYAA